MRIWRGLWPVGKEWWLLRPSIKHSLVRADAVLTEACGPTGLIGTATLTSVCQRARIFIARLCYFSSFKIKAAPTTVVYTEHWYRVCYGDQSPSFCCLREVPRGQDENYEESCPVHKWDSRKLPFSKYSCNTFRVFFWIWTVSVVGVTVLRETEYCVRNPVFSVLMARFWSNLIFI